MTLIIWLYCVFCWTRAAMNAVRGWPRLQENYAPLRYSMGPTEAQLVYAAMIAGVIVAAPVLYPLRWAGVF